MRLPVLRSRKNRIVAGVAALALVGAGVGGAFAFYSATTSGEGSTTLTGADLPTLDAYAEVPDLAIGESGTIDYYATNTGTGSESTYVKGVDGQTLSVVPATSTPCPGGTFELVFPVTQTPKTIAPGDTELIATQTVKFNDLNTVQNGCAGATLLVTFNTI